VWAIRPTSEAEQRRRRAEADSLSFSDEERRGGRAVVPSPAAAGRLRYGRLAEGEIGRRPISQTDRRTLVVVPTYLEVENIETYLRRARAAVPTADVLVVDDNSPDGTAALARAQAAELGQIEVLQREAKTGLGNAYRAGFRWGLERGYDVIVQMDADLSHDPAAMPSLLAVLDDGADLAIGSRYVPGGSIPHWPLHRRALSRYGNLYTRFALRIGVRDATSGYRAYPADTVRGIDLLNTKANGYGFQIENAYRVSRWGGKIAEVPIVFTDRVRGHSKMSWGVAAEEMWLVTLWGVRDRLRGRRGDRMVQPSA
jgi:dolichol-phosphate mannosyltransferase